MTSPLSQRAPQLSPELNTIVDEFARQLTELAEKAAATQSLTLLHDVFARFADEESRPTEERRQWLEDLTQGLIARMAQLFEDTQPTRGGRDVTRGQAESEARPTGPARRRPRRKPVRPPPPPLDPEQIKRDQEFARLRALLKPTADEELAPPPSPVPVATPPAPSPRPSSPGEILKALEKEIQDTVPTLGTLGPERCAAQIAAWVGQVRGLRDRLPSDVAATMRPAFRIFLEHLEQLRAQMETNVVDALEHNWKAPDWDVYVEVNRARAEQRQPNVEKDKLQMHFRAMLRALVLPHRRNVPQQAFPVIEEAARVLPADDNLLQSARRRHRALTEKQANPPEDPATAPEPPASVAAQPEPEPETTAFPTSEPVSPPSPPASQESEFDSPWLK